MSVRKDSNEKARNMLKKGDFIKVKQNTRLESGEIVNNWAGEIQEVYQKEKCCLITLDTQTMDALDDSYLRSCMDEGAEPYEYVFEYEDIELSERRDTDEQVKKALERLSSRMIALEKDYEDEYQELKEKWIEEFENTAFFESLNEIQKENSGFVLNTFMDFMYNYEYVQPQEWDPSNIKAVCLDIVPRKITSDEDTFKNYGNILIQYLKFLGRENYISNSTSLIHTVEEIKEKIPLEAKNPNNWGMAKSMMMSAKKQGFDLSNEDDIDKFMMLQQSRAFSEIEEDNQSKIIPLRKDPFKGIGRNQKISIRYNNGRIVEDIKFKKVESDLRNGNCEIIKK